jgi:putative DNA primase/helicase
MNNELSALDTALELLQHGWWPVAIHPPGAIIKTRDGEKVATGKEPIGTAWGKAQPTEAGLRKMFAKHPGAGVGVLLGPNGTVIDIEVDGDQGEESFVKLCGGEAVNTLGWSSRRGPHRLFRWDACLTPMANGSGVVKLDCLPGLEIRLGRQGKQIQSACPATIGEDGQPRKWNDCETIAPLPEAALRFLGAAMVQSQEPGKAQVSAKSPSTNACSAWLRKVLEREAGKVAKAKETTRHNTLLSAARTLGGYLHLDYLTEPEVIEALTHAAKRAGLPDHEIAETIRDGMASGKEAPLQLPAKLERLDRRSRNGRQQRTDAVEDALPLQELAKKPAVEINTDRQRVLNETLAALPLDPELFCRGNLLVRIAIVYKDAERLPGGVELRGAAGSVRVVPIAEASLSCRLSNLVVFFSRAPGAGGEAVAKPAHPPHWLVKAVLQNLVYPGVRELRGVAGIPFPRADGTLVTAPGYDPATGVYYWPSLDLPAFPDQPTQKDARDAAAKLLALVEQFPFASDDDRVVWLAALLTVVARQGIEGPVPGTAFTSNRPGTGKGKLIDISSTIATGRPTPTTSYPHDEAEARKLKTTFALAATPIVHLDNLDEGTTYGCGVLDSVLTSTHVNDRILGESRSTGDLELRCCWFVSGNNISPAKDAFRRWLVCNLVTELERPEERADLKIVDILAHVREHRAELVRAALVILKAHAVAGHPNGKWAPLGSFEQWDRIVRGAVWYATGRDCNATRRQAAEEAPDRLDRIALLEAWAELTEGGETGRGLTCAEVYALASETEQYTGERKHPDVFDVLMRFSKDGKLPSVRTIGNVIRAMDGRNLKGRAFKKAGQARSGAQWRVVSVNPTQPCESGESGESGLLPPVTGFYSHYINQQQTHHQPCAQGLETESPDSPDLQPPPASDCGGCFRLECRQCNPDLVWEGATP